MAIRKLKITYVAQIIFLLNSTDIKHVLFPTVGYCCQEYHVLCNQSTIDVYLNCFESLTVKNAEILNLVLASPHMCAGGSVE